MISMFPILGTGMQYYTGTSAAEPDSTTNATSPALSQTSSRHSSITPSFRDRKANLFGRSSTRTSTTSLSSTSSDNEVTRKTSISQSLKSVFSRSSSTSEERTAEKAEKKRQKRIERSERDAYRRAQDVEASAVYTAWRYGEGANPVALCMF